MRDKADLIDKSERLEHIVLQLQGETDTIGRSVSQSRGFGCSFVAADCPIDLLFAS